MDTAEKLTIPTDERINATATSMSYSRSPNYAGYPRAEALLRALTGSETTGPALRDAFESLLDTLGAHESIRRASRVLLAQSDSLPIHQIEQLASYINSFVASRRDLVKKAGEAYHDDNELFLAFRHSHEDTIPSYAGIRTELSLKLIGRASQPLWCKMFLRTNGKFVNVRDGWESWTDSVEKIPVTALGAASRVCAFTPLHVDRQRWYSESFSLFIPYAAMNLPVGRSEFEIEAGIYDSRGTRIVSGREVGIYYVPEQEKQAILPSPQSRDAWDSDPSSGCRIRVEEISRVGSKRTSQGRLSALISLVLNGFEDECLALEGRLMQGKGEQGEGDNLMSSVPEWMDRDGFFVTRISLLPKLPIESYTALELSLPLDVIKFESKEALFLDLTLKTLDGRIVCGTTHPVNF